MTIDELNAKVENLENRVEKFESKDNICDNTIISTIRCFKCGTKTKACAGGNTISFFCTNENCSGFVRTLTVEEIAAIMNFNPLT